MRGSVGRAILACHVMILSSMTLRLRDRSLLEEVMKDVLRQKR
jgi:hypothetical protein